MKYVAGPSSAKQRRQRVTTATLRQFLQLERMTHPGETNKIPSVATS